MGMLEYRAAYTRDAESGWYTAEVLDFPGALSQGHTLASARKMLRDALRELAEYLVEAGKPLPRPNTGAEEPEA
jgi:predicted RNase H-like HicB family nuclease